MNIIFHEKFYETYAGDPAAASGRMEPIINELKKYSHYKFITPEAALPDDLLRAHAAFRSTCPPSRTGQTSPSQRRACREKHAKEENKKSIRTGCR